MVAVNSTKLISQQAAAWHIVNNSSKNKIQAIYCHSELKFTAK